MGSIRIRTTSTQLLVNYTEMSLDEYPPYDIEDNCACSSVEDDNRPVDAEDNKATANVVDDNRWRDVDEYNEVINIEVSND